MCGIVAVFNKSTLPVDPKLLDSMLDVIVHRGPDDGRAKCMDNVGLGFRRLSIIDLSTGMQPLTNEDETIWLIFNGEIYNYQEHTEALKAKGHVFRTHTDSEVLIHLYEEYGTDFLPRLRGMFAFVIYDSVKKTFFGARDYFGIKPMYYTQTADSFVFGSEIKSLLQSPSVKREVNPQAFLNYLTFQYVPEPDTMFSGINKLPPASYFVLDANGFSINKYYQIAFAPDNSLSLDDYAHQIRETLEESILAHRMSDVPRGAFLSGGIDSTIICAMFKKYEDIHTFSVGYHEEQYSELSVAAQTAEILKTKHHEYKITPTEYLDNLPRLIWHQDEPVADPSAISVYFLARMAREYITVVLSGEGADELFAGYNIYREPHDLKVFDRIPTVLKPFLSGMADLLPRGIKGKSFIQRGCSPLEDRFFGNAKIFTQKEKYRVSTLPKATIDSFGDARKVTAPFYKLAKGYDDETRMQFIDLNTWLPGNILMKADKMTMANSLELRVPFLDIKVLELISRIPTQYKIAEGTTKYILRQAFKDVVPEHVVSKKKLGFPVPLRQWLKNEFFAWAYELIKSSPTDAFIDKKEMLRMLIEHKNTTHDNSRQLWTLLMFMLWHREYGVA